MMEYVKLGDICKPKQWKTISTSDLTAFGYPVYGANGIIGNYKEYNHKKETILVTCRGATCGSVNITKPYSYVNGNAMALDNLDKNIDINYLYFYLTYRGFNDIISGSAQPQIIRSAIEKILIPVPPIELQNRLSTLLLNISKIRGLYQKEVERLDELIKARFVEMFGNVPEEERVTIAEICKIITDGTHQPPKFTNTGIPFLFVSNIITNEICYDAEKFISEETYTELIKRTPIEIGDILLSTVGSYGHPAIVKTDRRFCFQRHIAYLKPKSHMVNSEYLRGAILSDNVQRQIDERVKGIAQKTLNLAEIRKIRLPLPPLKLQEQFADFVKQVDKSKLAIQKSLEKTQQLFDSLMQEYFG